MRSKHLVLPASLLLTACASTGEADLPSQTGQTATTQASSQRCDPIQPYRKSDGTVQYWSCDPQPICEHVTTFSWVGNYIGSSTHTVASFGLRYRHYPLPLPPAVSGSPRANATQQIVQTLRGHPLVQGERYELRRKIDCDDAFQSNER